jgi:LysM repeat protein
MKRKEAILIAVLINAGLLLVLLISAISSKEEVIQSSLDEAHVFLEKNPENMQPVFSGLVEEKALEAVSKEIPLPSSAVSESGVSEPVVSGQVGEMVAEAKPLQEIVHPLPSLVEENAPAAASASAVVTEAPVVQKAVSDVALVKKGDTLEKIAKRSHTTVGELKRINHLKSSFLRIGQKLQLPGKKALSAKAVSPAGYSEYYVVKHGDNPWTIAMKHHMKVEELLSLNQISSEKARHLRPGDKLRVR